MKHLPAGTSTYYVKDSHMVYMHMLILLQVYSSYILADHSN